MSGPRDPRKCFERKREFSEVKIPHKEVSASALFGKGFCLVFLFGFVFVSMPLLVLVPAFMGCLGASGGI